MQANPRRIWGCVLTMARHGRRGTGIAAQYNATQHNESVRRTPHVARCATAHENQQSQTHKVPTITPHKCPSNEMFGSKI